METHFKTIEVIEEEIGEQLWNLETFEKILATVVNYDPSMYQQNKMGEKFLHINYEGEILGFSEDETLQDEVFSLPLQSDLGEMCKLIEKLIASYEERILDLNQDLLHLKKLVFIQEQKNKITQITLENGEKNGYVSFSANENFELEFGNLVFKEKDFHEELFNSIGATLPLDATNVKDVIRLYYEVHWPQGCEKWLHKEFVFFE